MKNYTESQRFSSVTLFLVACLTLALSAASIWQVGFGHPLGNHPAPNFLNIVFTLFSIGLAVVFLIARLDIAITDEGFTYHFTGLLKGGDKTSWTNISRIEFMKFPYLLGEGTRDWNKKNATAYVTNGGGNMGIMIYRKDKGRNIFISTKQVEELRAFIKSNAPEGVEIVGD